MATIFRYPNFGGYPQDVQTKNILRLDKIGKIDSMPSGWAARESSMLVDKGINVCMYERPYLQMTKAGRTPLCIGEGSYSDLAKFLVNGPGGGTWARRSQSLQIRKDCNNPKWMWDEDCKYADAKRTVGKCYDKKSQCHRNRVVHCNMAENPSKECLDFCTQNPGSCDLMMKKYCSTDKYKGADMCACINSPAVKYNPLCIDSKCSRIGYATSSMIGQKCPSITDCGVYYDIKGTGGNIDFTDATVQQRCTTSQTQNQITVQPGSVPTGSPETSQPLKPIDDNDKPLATPVPEPKSDTGNIFTRIFQGIFQRIMGMSWTILIVIFAVVAVVTGSAFYFLGPHTVKIISQKR
jgi:hypothetical protein